MTRIYDRELYLVRDACFGIEQGRLAVVGCAYRKLDFAMMTAFRQFPGMTKISCGSPAEAVALLEEDETDFVLTPHTTCHEEHFQGLRHVTTFAVPARPFVWGIWGPGGIAAPARRAEGVVVPYDSRHLCVSIPWMSAVTSIIEVWRDEEAVTTAKALARSLSVAVGFITTEYACAHHASETTWGWLGSRRDLRTFSVLGREP